jgi:DNA-binding transcriptional MerR regulator
VFRAQEVCEIAQVQPYVLRGWEEEFPDLGMAKKANGQRVYRRGDVERVLRLKHLLFSEGLTLAGARRRLAEEGVVASTDEPVADEDVAALLDEEVRQNLRDVRRGLQWVLGVLDGDGVTAEEFVLLGRQGTGHKAQGKGAAKRGAHAVQSPEPSAKSPAKSPAKSRRATSAKRPATGAQRKTARRK